MKRILYILSLILWSCGGSSDEAPTSEENNEAPTVPVLVYPTNNLLCIENTINFQWNASTDSDNDVIDYTIQVSTDNQFGTIDFYSNGSSTANSFTLGRGVAYYWRVKATDSNNVSSDFSSTYSFFTEGDGVSNHLPFSPELISPNLNSEVNEGTVNLQWSASDTDGDPLTFDVYFGTQNPPINLIGENQTETNLTVTTVSQINYYWKVVVKDDSGGETIGQIWNFNTY